jgi:phage tail P2-like protein
VALAYRGAASAVGVAAGSSVTLSLTGIAGLAPNDIVVIFTAQGWVQGAGAADPVVSSSGWIECGAGARSVAGGATVVGGRCFYKRMGATVDTAVTVTGHGGTAYSAIVALALAFSGIATSGELNAATVVTTALSPPNGPDPGAIAPVAGAEVMIVAGSFGVGNSAPGTISGFTSPSPAFASTAATAAAEVAAAYFYSARAGISIDPPPWSNQWATAAVSFTLAFGAVSSNTRALATAGLGTASPAIDVPTFAIPVENFTVAEFDVGSPVATAATFNQIQGLAAPAFTTGSPALGGPALSQALTAVPLTVASPAITLPLVEASLFGAGLTLGSPQFGFPFMVQRQAIAPASLTVGSPALPALSTTSIVVLAPVGLAPAALGLPAGHLIGLLDPVFLVPGSPVIGAPVLGQQHNMAAAFAVGSPDLPAKSLYQVHGLAADGIATGSPVYSLASTLPQLPLFALEFDVGSPAIDGPAFNVGRSFATAGITVGSPSLAAAPFGQAQAFAPPSFATGSPVLDPVQAAVPLNGIAPSLNGQWLSTPGSPYALVSDIFHSYTLAADGTIYRDGVLTQASVIADGIEKATSTAQLGDLTITQMAWAWGSFGWAYYMAGVWVFSPPPNLQFPSTALTVASPVIGRPASTQIHNIPAVGLTVGSPQIGSTTFHAESAPGSYMIWQSAGKLYDQNNNVWTFGLVNPANASEAQVLRNGVNPYATVLYASVIQIGPPNFTYTDGGVSGAAPVTGWVRTAHGQWYFDNGGTKMVPWPAAPNFTMSPAGITTARPTVGTGPALTRHDALGFDVGSPEIGTSDLADAPRMVSWVFLPAPIGIELGPGNIVVAWPQAGEINHLVAQDLVVWIPDIGDRPLAVALAGNAIGTTDKINPYIDQHAGSTLLYRAASGLEKAMADVDGFRLMATYAELVKEQWDPYAISSQNLPFLAYAEGVNLWEADWDDTFRRWWVANQWELKQQRGSLLGTERFVSAVGQRVAHAIVPPAKFMPGKSLTDEERAAYNARFAQLRLYPYVARVQLPWLCYISNFRIGTEQTRRYTNNGCFLGPIRKMYPTAADAGGRYTRTATIWDRGVETPITVRTVSEVAIGGTVTTWDEVVVPAKVANHWYLGQPNRWPLPKGHPHTWNKYGIFLGIMEPTASRIIKIPRNGELDAATAKAIYQTIVPDNTYIDVYPENKAIAHPISARRLYCGAPHGRPKQFLFNKFLPTNGAFQFLYEVWYIFDYARVPDYRRASVYMGQARFGIAKYTAELRIDIPIQWRKWYVFNGGFLRGHLHPPDTREIDKCRRAVTASMAVRDTIRIDTIMRRRINTNDSLPCDGTFTVGQYIDA